MLQDVLLSLKNISKRYPGVLALDNVSLDIYKGETLAIVGENGAGKSTLIKILSGAITPTEGSIVFEDKEYSSMNPQLSTALGVSVIYQEFNLMDKLSVAENIYAGHLPTKNRLFDQKEMFRQAGKIFEEMKVKIDVTQKVEELSVAYMQLVEIAKSLTKNVNLLIMDEPTAPLTTNETELLFETMKRLKDNGVTIIYISHRLSEIFSVADRVTILRDGKKISTHEIGDITKEKLICGMVGREMKDTFPQKKNTLGKTILRVKNLCGNGVKDVSFELHRGEILGLAGLVGAGRTEIMRVLFGADKMESGEIYLDDKKVSFASPKQAVKDGVGLIPEDRKRQGAILSLPISQNISLPNLRRISKLCLLNKKKEREMIDGQIASLKISCYSGKQLAGTLSGGNQQKVVLAKWLASNAKVLIFDEPTRGIDVGAKQEIYNLLNKLCEKGMAIIMISSEMDEIIGMSDRIVVLYEGTQMRILEKEEFSQEVILTLASGENLRSEHK
ncbi:MAG: sugar ABC transporter ATP-binding protein [Oscillospiraceae bacterium]